MFEQSPNKETQQGIEDVHPNTVNERVDEIWPQFNEKPQTELKDIAKDLSEDLSGLAKDYADSVDAIYNDIPSDTDFVVPEYLLERSKKRRQELEQTDDRVYWRDAAGQSSEGEDSSNSILSLGLSEQFNDCSIAAASVCKDAYERIQTMAAKPEEFVFLGEDGNYGSVLTHNLTSDFSLPSGRKIRLVLGKDGSHAEAPLYLFAVTRDDLALRLASFQSRQSNVLCDYVQIGQEMDDEDFVVTPEDESLSRLDIIEHIRALTDIEPVDLNSSFTEDYASEPTTLKKHIEIGEFDTGKNKLVLYQIMKRLSDLKIIDEPVLLAKRQKAALDGDDLVIVINRRRKNRYQRFAELRVSDELVNESGRPAYKGTDHGLYSDDGRWLYAVIKMYKNQNYAKDEAQTLAKELKIEEALNDLLGSTTSAYERLFNQNKLPRLVQLGTCRGMRPDIQVGKIKTDSEFELSVEALGKSGYRITVSGRPDAMDEHAFEPFYTLDCYRDRPPTQEALASAKDISDLINHLA